MTTNHPEKLDPALIRPGRIDQKLELSYMAPIDVVAMLRHYFKTEISDDQRERVEQVILKENLEITPAQVEQLAMEQDNIEDLLDVLERRATKDDCSLTDTDTLSDDGDDHQVET
jgi:chaperone BCS1